ncbi:hypothetical protein C7E17_24065 [Stenotrophomonas maltophilia]|nr:hypothetical protein C7E17_24065 [Stenotrophomonas maltophilia]
MTMQRLHTGWASVQPSLCQGTAPMKHLPLAGLLLLSLTACSAGPDKQGAAGIGLARLHGRDGQVGARRA